MKKGLFKILALTTMVLGGFIPVTHAYASSETNVESKTGTGSEVKEITPTGVPILTGWQKIGKDWYYVNVNGSKQSNGWTQIDGQWYYFSKEGIMACNTLVNGYWIGANGTWQKR